MDGIKFKLPTGGHVNTFTNLFIVGVQYTHINTCYYLTVPVIHHVAVIKRKKLKKTYLDCTHQSRLQPLSWTW